MRADLHIHTVYSDGSCFPEELAQRAKKAGVGFLSFTDHDNMEGAEEKRAAAEKYGLTYVQGWEVSSYDGCKVHVLGYACEAGEAYRAFLEERRRGAVARAEDMIGKANACLGLSLTLADAERERLKKEAPLHTMHVAAAYGRMLGADRGELYLRLFAKGKPAYSDLYRPTPENAIDVIHACGGIAVLAHPGRIELPFAEREALMDRLIRYGLDGIECVYTTHTVEETEYFNAYAARNGLLVSGGSDFHAEGRNQTIGLPEFHASRRLLEALSVSGSE